MSDLDGNNNAVKFDLNIISPEKVFGVWGREKCTLWDKRLNSQFNFLSRLIIVINNEQEFPATLIIFLSFNSSTYILVFNLIQVWPHAYPTFEPRCRICWHEHWKGLLIENSAAIFWESSRILISLMEGAKLFEIEIW